jgi:hypothetical protein
MIVRTRRADDKRCQEANAFRRQRGARVSHFRNGQRRARAPFPAANFADSETHRDRDYSMPKRLRGESRGQQARDGAGSVRLTGTLAGKLRKLSTRHTGP